MHIGSTREIGLKDVKLKAMDITSKTKRLAFSRYLMKRKISCLLCREKNLSLNTRAFIWSIVLLLCSFCYSFMSHLFMLVYFLKNSDLDSG